MTLEQKLQQLTGAVPEVIPELPNCKGGRHVSAIPALNIPTFRITNGPVGLGQNDCVSVSVAPNIITFGGSQLDASVYADPSSAKATALPSAMGAAASFDPAVAGAYGDLIGTEMANLALHEFEAPGMNLAQWMKTRVATRATRRYDWDALKFQADYDPKYRRAQMRYIGTGATGVNSDENTVPAEHFTFSTMILPAGAEGPLHIHTDVEEVFFVLRGRVKLIAELNGETWECEASDRDLVSWPVGVYRGVINIGDEEALMCVIIGNPKPVTPTYPSSHPLSQIER